MSISIEHTVDKAVIERVNYTILDVLSDVGGLSSVIAMIFASVLSVTNYNSLNEHMINKLYRFKDKNTDPLEAAETYKSSRIENFLNFFRDSLP